MARRCVDWMMASCPSDSVWDGGSLTQRKSLLAGRCAYVCEARGVVGGGEQGIGAGTRRAPYQDILALRLYRMPRLVDNSHRHSGTTRVRWFEIHLRSILANSDF